MPVLMRANVRTIHQLFFALVWVDTATFASYGHERPAVRDTHVSNFMRRFVGDMVYFNKYLFLWPDTYTILLLSSPLYMAGRAIDKQVHAYFYDRDTHRNIHTIAPVFHYSVEPLMGIALGSLALLEFIPVLDAHTRRVSELFIAAWLFLTLYKDALKLIPLKGSLRPKNQCFSACRDYYGGFPSGHMFEAVLMAYLFGAELGPDFAVPLSALATLVAVQSVAINRHTVSQVVAGAALGVVFGVAAQKVVHRSFHRTSSYGILVDGSGAVKLSFEKTF